MFIDFGATRNFINLRLFTYANFPMKYLLKSIHAYNIDGTTNKTGTILWKAKPLVHIAQWLKEIKLIIVSLKKKQIILGMSC